MPSHHHRSSGGVRKENKKQQKAGVAAATGSNKSQNLSKWERKCVQKQQMKQKGESAGGGSSFLPAAPKLVAFIALHDSANPLLLKRKCLDVLRRGNKTSEQESDAVP